MIITSFDITRRYVVVASLLLVLTACASRDTQSPVAASASDHSSCRLMRDPSFIPGGWHPVTVQWRANEPDNDLVCIAKTEGKQIQVVAWKGFRLPSNYYIVYSDSTLNDRFRGCAQWSEWQGTRTCMTSWVMSMMQKNP